MNACQADRHERETLSGRLAPLRDVRFRRRDGDESRIFLNEDAVSVACVRRRTTPRCPEDGVAARKSPPPSRAADRKNLRQTVFPAEGKPDHAKAEVRDKAVRGQTSVSPLKPRGFFTAPTGGVSPVPVLRLALRVRGSAGERGINKSVRTPRKARRLPRLSHAAAGVGTPRRPGGRGRFAAPFSCGRKHVGAASSRWTAENLRKKGGFLSNRGRRRI